MSGLTLGLPLPAQVYHSHVDLVQPVHAYLPQTLPEVGQHIGHSGRVVAGPVVVERGQVQMLRHDIQLELGQLRQEILGQDQAVYRGIFKWNPEFPAPLGHKAHIKLRIVGRQRTVPRESQKRLQGFLLGRRALQHLVRDACETDDLRVQNPAGRHERIESVCDLAVFQKHRADFYDDLPALVQAGGLQVKADDLAVQVPVRGPVDHDPVVHVIYKIRLHAVQNLDVFCGVPRIRKGLGYAVIGDGNGPMAPALRPLYHIFLRPQLGFDRGERVHVGHRGMQMQLHPLFRRVVHLFRLFDFLYPIRLQHHIAIKAVHVQTALDPEVHSLCHLVHDALTLCGNFSVEKFADPDRPGTVAHIEGHHPGAPFFQLLVGHLEHVALNDHQAHIQLQLPDCHGFTLGLLAVDIFFAFRGSGRGAFQLLERSLAEGLRLGKSVLLLGRLGRSGSGFRFPFRLRLGGRLLCDSLQLDRFQAVGPRNRLLRLVQQIGSGSGRALDLDFGAAAGLVDGRGDDKPALDRICQFRKRA